MNLADPYVGGPNRVAPGHEAVPVPVQLAHRPIPAPSAPPQSIVTAVHGAAVPPMHGQVMPCRHSDQVIAQLQAGADYPRRAVQQPVRKPEVNRTVSISKLRLSHVNDPQTVL